MRSLPAVLILAGTLAGTALLLSEQASADIPPVLPSPQVGREYVLEVARSEVYAQVFKDTTTLAAGLSHDHVVVATGWTGSVFWDQADPAACVVSMDLPVSGLDNDDPAWRKRMNFNSELSESQRAEVKDHMVGAGQLDAARFGKMGFRSTGCVTDGDRVQVSGKISIHGVEKVVSLPMKITATDAEFNASGVLTMLHTDYGMSPFSAMGGALKNRNDIRLVLKVRGKAK
ncbi:MAG TPA: YceI family protein [Myxococcota bacterium]|nr:YceI family protein [Myxococcota bacterium]